MQAHNKKSFWNNTIIYGVGFVLLRSISFLLLPLYTNLLSAKEFGPVGPLLSAVALALMLFEGGSHLTLETLKLY